MMTANTGQAQAVLRSNLTQIAQLKESISSRYQNYDTQELTKI